ncbi:MAG: hypothetical protein QOE72_421 [Chloroflexota bacterium]|jgi:hypothetical protein|nr:hypothetical protein [Chloroflexota bacterium]
MVTRRRPPSTGADAAAPSGQVGRERPGSCSLCANPPAAMFEFRVRQRSVTVWICDTPHRADALGAALGLSADEAQTIALEIATHLHVWAAEEEDDLPAGAIG